MANTLAALNAQASAATAQTSALAALQAQFKLYGLDGLTGWAKTELAKGYDDVVVLQHMYDQPLFQQRFAAIFDRQKAGLPAISPADVVNYESAATEAMINAGMPKGFYDNPQDFRDLLGRDISIDELKSRINNGYVKVANAPQAVKDTFRDFYGADGDHTLAAFMLDPDKAMPLLEQQIAAASIAGTGRQFGIGTGKTLAETLAKQGVTDQQSQQTYQQLATTKGLFTENVDERDNLSVDKEGVEAAFGVNDTSTKKVQARSDSRQAAFAGSGGANVSTKGAGGLGTADQP